MYKIISSSFACSESPLKFPKSSRTDYDFLRNDYDRNVLHPLRLKTCLREKKIGIMSPKTAGVDSGTAVLDIEHTALRAMFPVNKRSAEARRQL